MKYDQKALYAELTHFYLSICEKEQLDEPRLRGLVGSLVRKLFLKNGMIKLKFINSCSYFTVIGAFIAMRIITSMLAIYIFRIF